LSFGGHSRGVCGVACSPDGQRIASVSRDSSAALHGIDGLEAVPSEVKVWEAATGRELLTRATEPINCVAFNPDGRRLVAGCEAGAVLLLDCGTGAELGRLAGHTGAVEGVACSRDGRWLASAGLDRTVRVWDAATGLEVHCLRGHAGPAGSVA